MLYGPEAAVFRRDQYDTAVWIWATMVARMLQARRDSFEGSREPRNARQLVTGFRSVIYDAAAAEFATATTCAFSVACGTMGQAASSHDEGLERQVARHRAAARASNDPIR